MKKMKRSDIEQPKCYFDKYISCAEDVELFDAFENSRHELRELDLARLESIGDAVYTEGK